MALGRGAAPGPGEPIIRFGIPANPTWSDAASISPDGRYVVYSGGLEGGASPAPPASTPGGRIGAGRFWLRALDALEPQRLSETQAALPLFVWSPDGRQLGYPLDRALMVREVPDGAPRVLVEMPSPPQGMAWSARGDLLIATAEGISQVPASGGPPALLLRTDPAREIWRGSPAFLPGGDRFLFTVLTSGIGEHALETRVAALDGRELATMLRGAVGAFHADGYLLFGAAGALYAQPFDAGRLSVSGERVQIAASVMQDWRAGRLAARASDTGVLVVRRAPRGDAQFTLVDRVGRTVRAIGSPDSYTNFSLSPDEQRLIAARKDPMSGRLSLWLIDMARGITSLVTDPGAPDDADDPTWAPDGRHVAYRRGARLVIRLAQGGPERTVIEGEAFPDSFSPDGRFLTFGRARANVFEHWSIDLDTPGAEPVPLVTGLTLADESRISPDGRWVAYHSNETGLTEVYVMPFPVTGEKWQVSRDGGVQPRWSSAGDELFYLAPDGKLMAVRMPASDPRHAAAPEALFPTGLVPSEALDQYEPTRDGFVIRTPVAGGSDAAAIQVIVNWRALVAGRLVGVGSASGGPPCQNTRFPDLAIVDFAWSADGTRLAVARQATTTDIVLFKGLR